MQLPCRVWSLFWEGLSAIPPDLSRQAYSKAKKRLPYAEVDRLALTFCTLPEQGLPSFTKFPNLVLLSLRGSRPLGHVQLEDLPSLRFLDLRGCGLLSLGLSNTPALQVLLASYNR